VLRSVKPEIAQKGSCKNENGELYNLRMAKSSTVRVITGERGGIRGGGAINFTWTLLTKWVLLDREERGEIGQE